MGEDRRIQRTQGSLQRALLELLQISSYDAVTIQDITDRANVGRTTFYLHYQSKEDLYAQAHQAEVTRLSGAPLTRDELLADDPPARMIAVYGYHWSNRDVLRMVYFGKDSETLHRQMRDHHAGQMAHHLQATFPEAAFVIPVNVLAHHLVISEMGLMQWWIEKHPPYSPQQMAALFHRLRRAVLRDGIASE